MIEDAPQKLWINLWTGTGKHLSQLRHIRMLIFWAISSNYLFYLTRSENGDLQKVG